MKVFAISDLHLAFSENKPMDIFGSGWDDYMNRIEYNWHERVGAEDLVLLPGDISWATYHDRAVADFSFIEALPGRKIITKGNHDYWWATKSKLNEFKTNNGLNSITFLQNDACFFESLAITGSRGWKNPDDEGFTSEDLKIYNREIERLRLSLKTTKGFKGEIIAMLHYPPFGLKGKQTAFTEILQEYGVKICIYGHLHGKSCSNAVEGEYDGIRYYLVSADYLEFTPLFLGEW